MDTKFQYYDIFYPKEAPGWVDGIYYPRTPQLTDASQPEAIQGYWKISGRVWKETEETGFGIYYYEETTGLLARLPGSNYRFRLILGNPGDKPYQCYIRANGILKAEGIEVLPGEEREAIISICMITDTVRLTILKGNLESVGEVPEEGSIYLKEVSIEEQEPRKKREKPRIFLASDSTVQSYERAVYPQTGWGQMLYHFFQQEDTHKETPCSQAGYGQARIYELDQVVIENRAIGGRSAKSFMEEGKLDKILEVLCPGDYVFVQFAHNDATAIRPNRYTSPEDFPKYLQMYIDACRKRGAQCVLVTPVAMRVPGENGIFGISFSPYREKMLHISREQQVPLLDLGAASTDYLNKIGEEESKSLYLWFEEGEYPEGPYAAGVSDKAHLQEYGACVYANLVAGLIKDYQTDHKLDELKALVYPKETIEKPNRAKKHEEKPSQPEDMVTGFVVQEISVQNRVGSFLLNWNQVKGAIEYHTYARIKGTEPWKLVRTVTAKEKEVSATLPFTAEAGHTWQYYTAAVLEHGREGRASRILEVVL